MQPTAYDQVNRLLDHLQGQIQNTLGDKLVGLYLYGSLISGDFDDNLSDVDLTAALRDNLNAADLDALRSMHQNLVAAFPQWDNRVEVAYITLHALRHFRTEYENIGIISPGEPLHLKRAGIDWLMNWYLVRSMGVTLFGPAPETIIAPVSREEFLQAVREHLLAWGGYISASSPHHGSQAYAILTMCRGLYTLRHGEHVSKLKAAAWAQGELPEWAALIRNALVWRQKMHEYGTIPPPPFEETERFVRYVIDRVATGKV